MQIRSVNPIIIPWGVRALNHLKRDKVTQISILGEDWLDKVMKSDLKRLWIDVVCFHTDTPLTIQSPFLSLASSPHISSTHCIYRLIVSDLVSFLEYHYLAESLAISLQTAGYAIYRCIYSKKTIDNSPKMPKLGGVAMIESTEPLSLDYPVPKSVESFITPEVKSQNFEKMWLDLFPIPMLKLYHES